MKHYHLHIILPGLLLSVLLLLPGGCSKTDQSNNGNTGYQYWTGSISNSYYLLNFDGERGLKVTGKPFMVIKYDKVSLAILDCEFGLSEVTETEIPTPSGDAVAPEPTLDASSIDYQKELGLKSPVDLLVSWNYSGYASKSDIVNGVQNFSFKNGISMGAVEFSSSWSFRFDNVSMTGDVTNIDNTYFMGEDSDSGAFSLMKK